MLYVLDCSIAVKWFVPEPLSDAAEAVLARYEAGDVSFFAPDTIVAEFGHSMRKLVLGGAITAEKALFSMDEFLGMTVERVPADSLARKALRLAISRSATFYDALYVTLALERDLVVLTADDRMARAFAGLGHIETLKPLRS